MTQAYTANLKLKKVTWQGGSPDTGADFLLDFNQDMDSIDALFSAKGHTIAPTVSDDSSLGHYNGEPWCDTTNHILYQAESVGVGAALWRQVWPTKGDDIAGNINATTLNGHADTYFAIGTAVALLNGRAGGQILYGGTGSQDNLYLRSTFHATKGLIYLGASLYYNETTGQLISTLADGGISPLAVTSGVVVGNLNSDKIDGRHETEFALLAGRSGGQTIKGDIASGGNLILTSTAHATKGNVCLDAAQTIYYNEVLRQFHFYGPNFNPAINDTSAIIVEGTYGGGILFHDGAGRCGVYSQDTGTTIVWGFGTGAGITGSIYFQSSKLGIGRLPATYALEVGGDIYATGNLRGTLLGGTGYCTGDVTTSGQTLTDVTGLAQVLAANEVWAFDVNIDMNSTSSAGIQFGITAPSGATIEWSQDGSTTGVTAANYARSTALATALTAVCTVAGDGIVRIKGTVFNGATPGNLQIQFLKVTSGTAKVYKGASIVSRKLA